MIYENADPDVVRDLVYGFEKVYPTNDSNLNILKETLSSYEIINYGSISSTYNR